MIDFLEKISDWIGGKAALIFAVISFLYSLVYTAITMAYQYWSNLIPTVSTLAQPSVGAVTHFDWSSLLAVAGPVGSWAIQYLPVEAMCAAIVQVLTVSGTCFVIRWAISVYKLIPLKAT
ncbi:hypothetical protein [Verrucomicrobium sp. GAS474]|uniref:hypothetical protein n=1 Tax=Verrucomicrobium sp. GAS474 TaxID=1882831 RepID=UPI000B83E33E|nr:hypothetical protein [Verrucomicrobium sp. GAS474]